MPKLSKETKKIIKTGQILVDLVKSEAWQEIRKRLISDVASIRDISSLTSKDEKTLFQEVAGRQIAAEVLLNWLRGIEGDADQYKSNSEILSEKYEESLIMRFEE